MKKVKLLYLFALLALVFASCNNDNDAKEYVYSKKVFLRANMEPFKSPTSASESSAWENQTKLGVYLTRGEGFSNILDSAANREFHNKNEAEHFWSVGGKNTIYYPKDDRSFNLVAYSPYDTTLVDNKFKVNVSDQSKQKAIDLVYSNNAKNVESAATQPTLIFKHQMAKVVINLEGTGGLPTLAGTTVKMQDMFLDAEFNLADATFNKKDARGVIATRVTIDANNPTKAIAEAIVIPSELADSKITITYKAKGKPVEYVWNAGKQNFESGKKHIFDVEIDAELGVLVRPTSTIEDWKDGSSETIEIDIDKEGEGDKEEIVTLLEENFGTEPFKSPWLKVADFKSYQSADKFTYTDPYTGKWADIRYLEKGNIWLPAWTATLQKECGFKIDGLPANRKQMKLEYQMLGQNPSTSTIIKVKANDKEVKVPELAVDKDKANWTTVTVDLPDNTTSVEFYSGPENTISFRIAAIKITGTDK